MVKMKVTTLSLFGFLCIAQANVQGQSSSSFKDDLQTTLLQNLADENTQILKELDSIKFVNAGEKTSIMSFLIFRMWEWYANYSPSSGKCL